jgi:hypothetical protein
MEKPIITKFKDFNNEEYISEESKGLWYNIHAKRKRGETPLKKGDKNYPNKKQWNKLTTEENEEEFVKDNNYMFWQNLKNIQEACNELLNMDKEEVNKILDNGHDWAIDHISTSCDDIEEVYHFIDSNIGDGYDGDNEGGYEDEYGNVEDVNLNESKYKGKEVELGKPTRGDVKKFKVYVKNSKGNVIKVNFGDPNMEIKRDDPERRKSFRARHKCSDAKDRTTPKYWSCKMWSSKPVSKILNKK